MARPYNPEEIETKWQEVWERERTFVVANPTAEELASGEAERPDLRARDVPLSLRQRPHGPRQELHHGGRDRPLSPPPGPARAAPHGLRRLRTELRERRHPDRGASGRLHGTGHRHHQPPAAPAGRLHRLEPRDRHLTPGVLQVDPVALHPVLQPGPRLQEGSAGQLVSVLPDRARQRAGHRRTLRALRLGGRGQEAQPVVLPHHRLRRPAAGGFRQARVLARAGHHHAAELDRQVDRCRRGLHHRAARCGEAPGEGRRPVRRRPGDRADAGRPGPR